MAQNLMIGTLTPSPHTIRNKKEIQLTNDVREIASTAETEDQTERER